MLSKAIPATRTLPRPPSQEQSSSALAGQLSELGTAHLTSLWSNLGVKVKPRTHIRGRLLTLFCDKWITKLGDGDLTKVTQLSNSTVKTQAQISPLLVHLKHLPVLPTNPYRKINIYLQWTNRENLPAGRRHPRHASFHDLLQTASYLPGYRPGHLLWLQKGEFPSLSQSID